MDGQEVKKREQEISLNEKIPKKFTSWKCAEN